LRVERLYVIHIISHEYLSSGPIRANLHHTIKMSPDFQPAPTGANKQR